MNTSSWGIKSINSKLFNHQFFHPIIILSWNLNFFKTRRKRYLDENNIYTEINDRTALLLIGESQK